MLGDVAQAEAALDSYAVAVDALYGTLSARLRELGLQDLFERAELPLCRVLAEMELTGCRVDKGALAVSYTHLFSGCFYGSELTGESQDFPGRT